MADEKPSIFIRKVKKGGHGAHGGSWKVAYADFMTAMMAFFLLMWLLSMVDPVKKEALAAYFNEYSLYKQGGKPFYQSQNTGKHERGAPVKLFQKTPSGPRTPASAGGPTPTEISADLKWVFENRAPDLLDSLQVDVFSDGVRINITDIDGRPLFNKGSDKPTEEGQRLLELTGEFLRTLDKRVAIGGHTDATAYGSSYYTNWELSAARASSARRTMGRTGWSADDHLVRVSGYAASDPFVRGDPNDARNRRITITIYNGEVGTKGWDVPQPFQINEYLKSNPYPPPGTTGAEAPATLPAEGEGEAAPTEAPPGPEETPPLPGTAPAGGE